MELNPGASAAAEHPWAVARDRRALRTAARLAGGDVVQPTAGAASRGRARSARSGLVAIPVCARRSLAEEEAMQS